MNAEKFIKNEAKQSLSNGNRVKAITAVFVAYLIPVISLLVFDIAYTMSSVDYEFSVDMLTESPLLLVFFIVFQLIAVVSFVLLSPIFNGYARLFCSVADKKEADIADIFYFFDTKGKYVGSVRFMLNIFVRSIVIIFFCIVPGIAVYTGAYYVYHKNFARSADLGTFNALSGIAIILIIIGVIVAVCILHRYLFAISLYSYYGYDELNSFRVGAEVAKKHTVSLIKLTVSFIPWILLTVFVVPFVYVYPYMTASYFVSVKYLFVTSGLQLEAKKDETAIFENSQNNEGGSVGCDL